MRNEPPLPPDGERIRCTGITDEQCPFYEAVTVELNGLQFRACEHHAQVMVRNGGRVVEPTR